MVKYTPQEVIAKSIYLIDDTDTLFQLIVAVEYYCPCDKILKNIKYNVLLFSTLVQCERWQFNAPSEIIYIHFYSLLRTPLHSCRTFLYT